VSMRRVVEVEEEEEEGGGGVGFFQAKAIE
jgi:hypothetical protein